MGLLITACYYTYTIIKMGVRVLKKTAQNVFPHQFVIM